MTGSGAGMLPGIGGTMVSGRWRFPPHPSGADVPLIVAIHGGTYTSAYFDVPGYSLLDRADALGIPVLALDRPGYGQTAPFSVDEGTIERHAQWLDQAIRPIWDRSGAGTRGVFLVGHSIGAAIAVTTASRHHDWPLLGMSISGVGLLQPPELIQSAEEAMDAPLIRFPEELKEEMMFGPVWTCAEGMPAASRIADSPAPRAELLDIIRGWPRAAEAMAARITVPVHYRQGEYDKLYVVDDEQVTSFGRAFSASPLVDAGVFPAAGHCIDFHRAGLAFQLEQLAFAERCCAETARPHE